MQRLLPPVPTPADIARMSALCDLIENTGDEVALAEWNARAGRHYTAIDFKTYYEGVSKKTFVEEALSPPPYRVEDLRFDEAVTAVKAICDVTISEAELRFVLAMLESNLPDAMLSDLIYWPDHWFGDPDKLHVALTPEQIVAYAMKRSGRALIDAPALHLPYPLPA